MIKDAVNIIGDFVFFYPVIMSMVWMLGGIFFFLRREKGVSPEPPPLTEHPLVSILIPARNEEEDIAETVEAVLSSSYPNIELIVINDASTDNTQKILEELSVKHNRLKILRLEKNMGKANGLNLAFAMSHGDIIMTIDADSALAENALEWIVWHFQKFPRVGALTGNPCVRNRTSLLAKLQTAEYASVIGLIKRTHRLIGKVMTVSGVIAAWRRTAIVNVSLWNNEAITDDIEMTWKMEKKFWDIRYEPNVRCWMRVPETWKGLWNQRKRWAQGGIEVIIRHWDVWKSWKYRRIWPVYIDYVLGVFWAFAFLLCIFLWSCNMLFGAEYIFGTVGNPFINWNGAVVSTVCLLQFFVSIAIDSKYDKELWKTYIWTCWYPVVYWAFNSFATVAAIRKAVFRKKGTAAIWVSPDRGIRSQQN